MKTILLATAAVLLAGTAFAQDETIIDMKDVPQAAIDAANSRANGIEFETVSIDDDEGTRTYEFAGKTAEGLGFEVDVLEDGTVEEVEEEISADELPQAVQDALAADASDMQPTLIEKSTRDSGIVYELEGTLDGNEVDAEINEDGTGLTINDDMAG